MEPYTFKQLAADVLQDATEPLTVGEIWEKAQHMQLTSRLRTIGVTPAQTLYADLHRSTQDEVSSQFIRVGSRPRRFWLRTREAPPTPEPGAQEAESEQPSDGSETSTEAAEGKLTERDLHPLVAWFADARMGGLLVKTIYHERSKKKAFGEWVHPDLVGVLFPSRALDNEYALRLSSALSAPLCRLFSFEVKLTLGFGNLREAFFQAVSNSSWAHQAFLVAGSIDDSPEFLDELERLSEAFGVGVIELPVDEVQSSRIRFPSRERSELDWTTVDKLTAMNGDFAPFLKNVTDDLKTSIHSREYDSVLPDPQRYVDDLRRS